MFGAQSVPRFTDTSAETTAPLADSNIHYRLDKSSPLVDQAHIKFADVSHLWIGKLSPAVHSRCYSRLGSDPVNSAATVL